MKKALSTIIYMACFLIFVILVDYLLALLLDSTIFNLINFFNGLGLLAKLIILFLGGACVISLLFFILGLLAGIVSQFVFARFPLNKTIVAFSTLVFAANVILGIKVLWDSFPSFGFWTFIEFLMLIGCFTGLNYVLIAFVKSDK